MRKFRNAALAAVTATAVAFGGTAVASADDGAAQTDAKDTSNSQQTEQNSESADQRKEFDLSSNLGKQYDADQPAHFKDFSSNAENLPEWAGAWRKALNAIAVATGLGAIIAAGNWALNKGLLPQIQW